MRVALYARVSTTDGQNPEMQLVELREYAQRRGFAVFEEYVDVGMSGAKEKRPELNRLMTDAHRRRFDAVVVWKFDRFARSVSHLLRALETFNSLGIAFISFSEQIDTTTPAGKMIFTVLGAVAELERELIRERVKAGLKHARMKGRNLGRPKANRVVGVCVHNLKNSLGDQASPGANPFDYVTFTKTGVALSTVVKLYNPPYSDSAYVYKYIKDNLSKWVEEAIEIRNSH